MSSLHPCRSWLVSVVAGVVGMAWCGFPATAQEGSPRRTRTVEIIQQAGAGVVAIFAESDGKQRSGSGSILDPRGYVLTNDHVVAGGSGIVLARGLPPLKFEVVGRLWERDLTLLKVSPPGPLPIVPLGRSHDLLAGEPILIGGNPGGRGITFSAGIVSAPAIMSGVGALVEVLFPNDSRDRFIQFDAASNPGNSGGPLINAEGRQIGVVTGKIKDEENTNYAIPIDRFHRLTQQLLIPEERGNFTTGLELGGPDLTVTRVLPDGPAAAAGLQAGDALVAMEGFPVNLPFHFHVSLVGRQAGESFELNWLRQGKLKSGTLKLAPYMAAPPVDVHDPEPGLAWKLIPGKFKQTPPAEAFQAATRQGTVEQVDLTKLSGIPADEFAIQYEGWLEIPADDVYWFSLTSDDGSRMWLDETVVVDNDGTHPPQAITGRRRMSAGRHPVRIIMFEVNGGEELSFSFGRDRTDQKLPQKWWHAGEKQ